MTEWRSNLVPHDAVGVHGTKKVQNICWRDSYRKPRVLHSQFSVGGLVIRALRSVHVDESEVRYVPLVKMNTLRSHYALPKRRVERSDRVHHVQLLSTNRARLVVERNGHALYLVVREGAHGIDAVLPIVVTQNVAQNPVDASIGTKLEEDRKAIVGASVHVDLQALRADPFHKVV